ncbi:heme o synthase [Bacillus solimangrovi]|uniref:Protoheme IX farnesyltransferase n=1 Tax=Bacillus solimangrovi TaxID=1305675 RepID=A0A1E5LIK3_9BACI|nr:heme o synthase [Bacillus solimangrovi]OEH93913.1 protoheme IX farnesyltransferase [Bacillus solimangrovi]
MSNPRTIDSTADQMIENRPQVSARTNLWGDFLALIKVGIINSNLITTFTGLWLALHYTNQDFIANIDNVLFAIFGTALVIAGGCTLNNYYDRDIDHIMERTKNRPTVTGNISLTKVLTMGIGFTILGTVLLAFASITAAIFGLIGFFSYVVLYTMWSKRRFTLNTIVGSISGAVPPLIGWAAIDSSLHPVAWVLFLIVFIWQTPHFLALAMKKCEDYRAAGIPMLPVVHGFAFTKRQIIIYVICLLPVPFYLSSLGLVYVIIAGILGFGWVALSIAGFYMKDDLKWATMMFIYSLNYLTILFVAMVVVTI